jgi:hypothetical protein
VFCFVVFVFWAPCWPSCRLLCVFRSRIAEQSDCMPLRQLVLPRMYCL